MARKKRMNHEVPLKNPSSFLLIGYLTKYFQSESKTTGESYCKSYGSAHLATRPRQEDMQVFSGKTFQCKKSNSGKQDDELGTSHRYLSLKCLFSISKVLVINVPYPVCVLVEETTREDIPLKTGTKQSKWYNCNEDCMGGSKFINVAFGLLTIIVTIALIVQIYYGDYQVGFPPQRNKYKQFQVSTCSRLKVANFLRSGYIQVQTQIFCSIFIKSSKDRNLHVQILLRLNSFCD